MEDAVARSSLAGLSLVTTALSKSSHRVRDSDLLSSGPPPSSPTAHTWITASSTPAPRRASLESSAERAATPTPRFDKSPSASSASDQIGGSSPFYTASWGSPYSQTFLDPQEQELFHRHRQRTPSTEPEADHPILQTDPAQWHPVPSKFVTGSGPRPSSSHQPLLCHKPEPAVSTTSRERANHTGRAFKDERVRLYLPRQTSSERSNWWSDDSSDAETDELAPRDVHKLSTWDDGVFWLDAGQGLDGISVAPTAKAPSQRRRRSTQRTSAEQGNLSTGHTSTGSDETIRQRDIWDPPTESKQDLTMGNDLLASKWATAPAEPARPIDEDVRQPNVKAPPRKDESPLVEKSLPLMPSPAPDGDNVEPGNSTTPKSAIAAKSMPLGLSRTPSSQITRKRLIWKGKACVIAPPSLDNRGDGVHYPRLLSSAEVSKRLKAWEEKGFDVRGFDHCHQYGGLESRGGESQSRPVYPSSETFREESAGGRYIVRIPDRQEWDTYVDHLKEERLRALGVSTGEEEGASTMSATSSTMGRQRSIQSSRFILSSPPQTSSAASNHSVQPANSFALPLTGGSVTDASSQVAPSSLASVKATSGPHMALGYQEKRFGSQYQAPHQLPPHYPATSQPQRLISPSGVARIASIPPGPGFPSPAFVSFNGTSEGSPLHQGQFNTLATTRSQQRHAENRPVPQQVNGENRFDPQDSHYHLEASFERQIDEGDTDRVDASTPFDSENILPDNFDSSNEPKGTHECPPAMTLSLVPSDGVISQPGVVLHSPQPRARPHSLSLQADQFGSGSGPSQEDGAMSDMAPASRVHTITDLPPHAERDTSSMSKGSKAAVVGSKLNVEAKEFMFRPGHAPSNLTLPNWADPKLPLTALGVSRLPLDLSRNQHASHGSASGAGTKLNVEAAAFRPLGYQNASFPTAPFSFSSSGPSFKQPVANMGFADLLASKAVEAAVHDTDIISFPNRPQDKIFDIASIILPANDSKVIPIVPPSDSNGRGNEQRREVHDDGEQEDESGRITQAQSRHKKMRRTGDDGDETPRFAMPSHLLTNPEEHPQLNATIIEAKSDHQPSNRNAETGKEDSVDSSFHSSVKDSSPRETGIGSGRSDSNTWEPFKFRHEDEARSFDVARPPLQSNDRNPAPAPAKNVETDDAAVNVVTNASITTAAGPTNNPERTFSGSESPVSPVSQKGDVSLLPSSEKDAPLNTINTAPQEKLPLPRTSNLEDVLTPSHDRINSIMWNLDETESNNGLPNTQSTDEVIPRSASDIPSVGLSIGKSGPSRVHNTRSSRTPKSRRVDPSCRRGSDSSLDRNAFATASMGLAHDPPIHRLNSPSVLPGSDWDGVLSSSEEQKLQSRSGFFDGHVDRLVGRALDRRFAPLEESVGKIHDLVELQSKRAMPAQRNGPSIDFANSDADDEEDDETDGPAQTPLRSPKRERWSNIIRSVLTEAMGSCGPPSSFTKEVSEIRQEIAGLKASSEHRPTQESYDLAQTQIKLLEATKDDLQRKALELETRNAVLDIRLQETKLAEQRRREESEEATQENRELRKTIEALRLQMEESTKVRESFRGKFDRLQEDVFLAASRIEDEQATWRKKEKEHTAARNELTARLESEARIRQQLEREAEHLKVEQVEAIKLRVSNEQLQNANLSLEGMLEKLRFEKLEYQNASAKYQNELHEMRELERLEMQRASIVLQSKLDEANGRVTSLQAELGSELSAARAELQKSRLELENARESYRVQLDGAAAAKQEALEAAAQAADASMHEQHRKYERHLDDLKFQHDLSMSKALEDRENKENNLLERLNLSNSKTEHLQERVTHLEEKLEVAQTAAQAAVQAAHQARATTDSSVTGGSYAQPLESGPPGKVSAQALRESILALQEQLQERESQIEKLEQELSDLDRNAPAKLKDQEAEIAWLRELLGVRVGDLEDIIRCLSQENYDRSAVKDAAIRLKANLDMEKQERGRSLGSAYKFPSFTSISGLSSPKTVLPLAAAWGNWRKGRDGNPDRSFVPSQPQQHPGSQTPSKPSASQRFLSGLLTPPSTQLRRSPSLGSSSASGAESSMAHGGPSQGLTSSAREEDRVSSPSLPSTPTLLRQSLYDQDAKAGSVGNGGMPDGLKILDVATTPTERILDEPFSPTAVSHT